MKEKKQNLFFETERLINSIINEANTYRNTLYNYSLLEDQICAFSDNLKEIIYTLNRTITIFNDLYRINNLTIDSDIEENIILIDELFNEYILKFKGLISKD